MGRKEKKSKRSSVATSPHLETLIDDHSLFFDRLVELIPARFYVPSPDDERPWFQGLSKAARAASKKETRLNIKKARRERLDPEKNAQTTLDLLKKSIDAEKEPPSQQDFDAESGGGADGSFPKIPDNRSVTYEELRMRLQRKIEELRGNRNTRVSERPGMEKRKKGETSLGKHKREAGKGDRDEGNEAKKQKRDSSGVDFSFGKVKVGDYSKKAKRRMGRSKKVVLEKAEKLKELMRDPEKGERVKEKHSWKTAASRAAGDKVHDDPKLIRVSMKKEKKRHEKSVEKWKQRVEVTRKMKAEKQKKRVENISEKIEKKKMKKISKREKKLMRPGFEGRKDGYINRS